MMTLNGEKRLDSTYNCEVAALDISTGKQIFVVIGRQELEFVVFTDLRDTYAVPADWYIDGKIKAETIISQNLTELPDKFGNMAQIKVLEAKKGYFGVPNVPKYYEGRFLVTSTSLLDLKSPATAPSKPKFVAFGDKGKK